MAKVMDDMEALFIETPVKGNKVGARPVRKAKNVLEGVSSWRLVGELFKRHNMDLQIAGFWIILAIVVWQRLG